MTPEAWVEGLARAVRAAVRPRLGHGREVVGQAKSGDASFALDHEAEEAAARYIADTGLPVAVYSEDRGLVGDPHAEYLLVLDPIDGTRPAKCGLESCCVSVALAANVPGATLGDVLHAAVYEIKDDRLFLARRGGGVRLTEAGVPRAVAPSTRRELTGAAMSVEITGRPIVAQATVLEEVIDHGSLRGGTFCFASSTFALTRLVTGQLDLHADVGDRIRRDVPRLDGAIRHAGQGAPIGLFVYDLAGVLLVARESGLTVTDAYGRGLDNAPLTDVSLERQLSCLAAGTPELHAALLAAVERGVARLAALPD